MDELEIGLAVRDRRKQLSLSQDELAVLAGVGRVTISTLENGGKTRGVTLGNLLALCRVLGLEVALRSDT